MFASLIDVPDSPKANKNIITEDIKAALDKEANPDMESELLRFMSELNEN